MLSTAMLVPVLLSLPGEEGQAGAVEPRLTTASMVIPAAAFTPSGNQWNYSNNGNFLRVGSGYGHFFAPVQLPLSEATITRITLYAYDNHPAQVCAVLYRIRPATAVEKALRVACTTDSTADPRASPAVITGGLVNQGSQSAYLHLSISGTGVRLYGVKVTYTY